MDINIGTSTVKLTRKPHRKVRTGCSVCKARKIKCDEQKPQCGRCMKYGGVCDILDAQQAHASHRINVRGPAWQPPLGPERLNMLELELMCHWDTSTCLTLSPSPAMQLFFKKNTVTIALRCDYVALAMLSLAAFHLAHIDPSRRGTLLEVGLQYHNAAARKAIELLPITEGPDSKETIENLFVFSSLTVFYAIMSSEQTYELLLGHATADESPDWITLFLGASHLALATASTDNRFSILFPMIRYIMSMMDERGSLHPETCMPLLRERIEALDFGHRDLSPKASYLEAIRDLDQTWAVMRSRPEARDLTTAFSWLHPALDQQLPELRQPAPPQEALVVFCYFCIMMEEFLEHWWLGGWPSRVAQQTFDLLDEEHRSWVVRPPQSGSPGK